VSTLSPREMFLLDAACYPIREAFDATPYLVGTAAAARTMRVPRDVDVRLILDNKAFQRLTRAIGSDGIAFLGLAIGQYLVSLTSLPVDFQIQQQSAANRLHTGRPRNPLGVRTLTNYTGDAPQQSDTVKGRVLDE
jgi:hypothetical protein